MTKSCISWECKHCGLKISPEYVMDVEEELWAHIQMEHEEIYESLQDLETPYMIDEAYNPVFDNVR